VSKPYLFTADLHLGSSDRQDESRKEAALAALIEHAGEHAAGLVLLGDLFEFWFEYRHTIPKRAARLLTRIADLHESGVPVDFIGGNHDVWLAGYLAREFNVSAHSRPISLSIGSRRVFVAHGDEMVAGNDPGYRLLRRILRNRVAPRLFALLHPDLGIPLGRAVSGWSREYKKEKDFFLGDALAKSIESAFDAGHDAVVMGHLHTARHLKLPRGECLILGGWSGRLSVVSLDGGEFRHLEWPAGGMAV